VTDTRVVADESEKINLFVGNAEGVFGNHSYNTSINKF
jgi:hypothetical protein